MTMHTRIYNPGFLEPEEMDSSFCVRILEFSTMVKSLSECSGNSNIHQIVIGPRGIGKTSLLLKVVSEIHRDTDLLSRFFPVVFAEESYRISTAGEFWLECLSRLAMMSNNADGSDLYKSFEDLKKISDDQMLEDRCLGRLQDFSAKKRKRLVLIVENLNMLFQDMADDEAGWRLRHVLQNEPCVVLLASATSRFDEIDNYDKALYDLFNVLTLQPLGLNECETLWQNVTGQVPTPPKIAALRILTGGNPRLLTIVARFGNNLSMAGLINDIMELIDDHTEYFKSHIDALPPAERRVYLALAEYWKPATAKEISILARLDINKCSAYLKRLTNRGAVEVVGGSTHRKLYYLPERLFNIYYLMRQARGPDPLVIALIHFMEVFYSTEELNDVLSRISRETQLEGNKYQSYSAKLIEKINKRLNEKKKFVLQNDLPSDGHGVEDSNHTLELLDALDQFGHGISLEEDGEMHAAINIWQGIANNFTNNQSQAEYRITMSAHVRIGHALTSNKRFSEAITVWNEILHRYRHMRDEYFQGMIATALIGKGIVLEELNRPEEALATFEELIGKFQNFIEPDDLPVIANTISRLASALYNLGRYNAAVDAWSNLVNHMGNSQEIAVRKYVFHAITCMVLTLHQLEQIDLAITTAEDAEDRFLFDDKLEWLIPVKLAKAEILMEMEQPESVPGIVDTILHIEDTNIDPVIRPYFASASNLKGIALAKMNRIEEAIEQWSELANRHENNSNPLILREVVAGLNNKGRLEVILNRFNDALISCNLVITKIVSCDDISIAKELSDAYSRMIVIYNSLNQKSKVLEVCDNAIKRFGEGSYNDQLLQITMYQAKKAEVLHQLDRMDEAVTVWKELEQHKNLDHPLVRLDVSLARLNLANHELANGSVKQAIEYTNMTLQEDHSNQDIRLLSYLIRAHAQYINDNLEACICDLESGLDLLQSFRKLSKAVLIALTDITLDIGPRIVRDVIQSSNVSDLLLPFTTALELEMRLEPRVAREVEEVAKDILQDMKHRRHVHRNMLAKTA